MYRIGQKYKLELKKKPELKKPIIYTARILEEDDIQIKIKTVEPYNEELVVNKSEIAQSKLIDQDSIGEESDKRR